jgi:hypothetical protein
MPSSGMWRRVDLQGRKIRERGTSVSRWLQTGPPGRFTQDLHGATSQKKAFFIVTALKVSNLKRTFPPVMDESLLACSGFQLMRCYQIILQRSYFESGSVVIVVY